MLSDMVDHVTREQREIERVVRDLSFGTPFGRSGVSPSARQGELTLWERIQCLMISTPAVAWSPADVAEALEADKAQVTALLHRRFEQGRIDRPARGLYVVK